MFKRFSASLLAGAMLLSATAAPAAVASEYKTTYGNWSALFVANNSAGLPMCSIASELPNGSRFMLKAQGDGGLFVHIFKDSWDLPLDTRAAILWGYDKEYKFNSIATVVVNGRSRGLSFNVSPEYLPEIRDLIKRSRTMWIGFKTGNEPPWRIDMNGARPVLEQWSMCTLAIMAGPTPSPTQPYSQQPQQPTQPAGRI